MRAPYPGCSPFSTQHSREAISIANNLYTDPSDLNTEEDWEIFLNSLDSEAALPSEESENAPQKAPGKKPAKKNRKKRRGRGILVALTAIFCIALLAALGYLFVLPLLSEAADPYGGKILDDVYAGSIDLGGMSRSEAAKAVNAAYGNALKDTDMEITLPTGTIRLAPQYTHAELDTDQLIADAFCFGRTDTRPSGNLEIRDYLQLDADAVRNVLSQYIDEASASYTPASCTLEGIIPPLEEDAFRSDVPCPKLVIYTGTPGRAANLDSLYQEVLDAYAQSSFAVDASDLLEEKVPVLPTIEELVQKYCIAAVSASIGADGKLTASGSYGMGFDTEKVQAMLDSAGSGETLEIQMEYVAPEAFAQDVYFTDVLGFCQTPYTDNEKRNENLRLACAALNGVVLQPGDILSYNDTLGQRTEERGYQKAPAYSGVELVDSLGGGICQVSSTLYLCSLYAGLETVDRVNHGFPAGYIPPGLDATVSWGSPDLKIQNIYDTPVKIVAEVQDGFVCVWILGRESRDYYVRMAFGAAGTYAKSSICKYDRKTDELISKEDHRFSGYLSELESVVGEIGPNQIYRFGMAREQEMHDPSPEILEASRRNIAPNAFAES